MLSFVKKRLCGTGILCGAVPFSLCRVLRPYLALRAGISPETKRGTAILLAVPYYTPHCDDPNRNLSAYAVSKDYHLFFRELFDDLLPALRAEYPDFIFAGFTDHSPIDEIFAAATAGLGVIGRNRMLITEKYSSYVFLGEILTDAEIPCDPIFPPPVCEDCGRCTAACPSHDSCLSALTQKKGDLTEDERKKLLSHPLVWGCDACQEVCPHTKRARAAGTLCSEIPFFSVDPIPRLTADRLDRMTDAEFSQRAYSWRGRETIRRNLLLTERSESSPDD